MNRVAYFYSHQKITFLVEKGGKKMSIDYSLEQLEGMLRPRQFFRVNRQFIVNIDAIEKMTRHTKSRVRITLNPPFDKEPVVSTERAPIFKKWLVGEV